MDISPKNIDRNIQHKYCVKLHTSGKEVLMGRKQVSPPILPLCKRQFSLPKQCYFWKLGGVTGEGVSKIPTAKGEFYTHTTFSKPVRFEGIKLSRVLFGTGSCGDRSNIPKVPSVINRKDKNREQVRKGK